MTFCRRSGERRETIKSWLRKRPQLVCPQPSWRDLAQDASIQDDALLADLKNRSDLPAIPQLTKEQIQDAIKKLRNLPHWQGYACCYFVTMVVQERQAIFSDPRVAQRVTDCLLAAMRYSCYLDAFVLMPDHMHLLIQPRPDVSFFGLMKQFRSQSARMVNAMLDRKGKLWQSEGFDHIVRHQAYWVRYLDYIHANPVKAKICEQADAYPFSSLRVLYGFGPSV